MCATVKSESQIFYISAAYSIMIMSIMVVRVIGRTLISSKDTDVVNSDSPLDQHTQILFLIDGEAVLRQTGWRVW